MKIKMLQTRRGSEDGFNVQRFEQGQSYDMADSLARQFLKEGWAYNDEDEQHPSPNYVTLPPLAGFDLLNILNDAHNDFERIFGRKDTKGFGTDVGGQP